MVQRMILLIVVGKSCIIYLFSHIETVQLPIKYVGKANLEMLFYLVQYYLFPLFKRINKNILCTLNYIHCI